MPSLSSLWRVVDKSKPAEIDQHSRLEQCLGAHRQFAPPALGACEQRGDAMRQCPQMQAHHQSRRPAVAGQARAKGVGRAAQHRKSAVGGLAQLGVAVERQAGLEHRGVERGFFACEGEVGAADILERDKGVRPALFPGAVEAFLEQFEAAARHIGEQCLAVAKMPVGSRRADPGRARRIGEGEPRRPFLGNQVERGADQRLAQIAVVIAATPGGLIVSRPAHARYSTTSRPMANGDDMADDRKVTLFHSPKTRSSGALTLLEELGAPYELRVLNMKAGEQRRPEYLAINPMGKVPALKHGDALVTEQVAIFLYLADLFPEARLAPPIGDPLRGPYLRWMVFYAACFEPAVIDRATQREPAPMAMSPYGDYETMLHALTTQLAVGPYLLGQRFTAADVLWGGALTWTTTFKLVPELPVITAYIGRCGARPSVAMVKAKDAELAAAHEAAVASQTAVSARPGLG